MLCWSCERYTAGGPVLFHCEDCRLVGRLKRYGGYLCPEPQTIQRFADCSGGQRQANRYLFTEQQGRRSGDRLSLGVGMGGVTQESEAMGSPYAERGALTDEAIGI